MKKLESELLNKGYTKEVNKTISIGTTIMNTYYTKNNTCVKVLKVGKGRNIISFYSRWDNVNKCGYCDLYDATEEKILEVA